jgi:glycosyltransferase involved in cell wall biosynthesis
MARPHWSVMIPTYHSARYLGEARRSVLAQDPGPERMQIEVVDDGSTRDDPLAVVREVGGGRVDFHRQPRNVGHTRNFATGLVRSRGVLVHLLHGDDAVRPGFYRAMERAFERSPGIGAAFCRSAYIDEEGRPLGLSPAVREESGLLEDAPVQLALEQRIMTPAIVVRRAVYEQLGGFDRRLVCSEDWEMWVRIAAHHPVWYEAEPLALYRMHADSNTGRHVRSAEDVRYTREAIRLISGYLPPDVARRVSRRARRTYALSALETAGALARAREMAGAANQVREALRLSRSPSIFLGIARVAALAALGGAGSGPGAVDRG